MTFGVFHNHKLLWLILIFNVFFISWDIGYNSPSHDEALMLEMGKQIVEGQPCPLCPQHTGSVFVQPIFVYLGDMANGLNGARLVSTFFGMLLIVSVYIATYKLYSQKVGYFAAIILMSTGTCVYLSKMATYDIVAAFFLSVSYLMTILSLQDKNNNKRKYFLFLSALTLFIAGITKYAVAIFWLPFMGYIFKKNQAKQFFPYFFLPFIVMIAVYLYLAFIPALGSLSGSTSGLYRQGRLSTSDIGSRIYYWLAIPYLLAIFGFYHKNAQWRKTVITWLCFSLPILLLHLLTGDSRSIEKNVIFALIFVVPAAAIGVDHMGNIFSVESRGNWVKNFFCILVLIVVWAFGLNQLRWLEHQFPNLSPVLAYMKNNGFDGMTIVLETDYGNPEVLYQYGLRERFPHAKFFSTSRYSSSDRLDIVGRHRPDFIIFDEYYSAESLLAKIKRYETLPYAPAASFSIPLPWGKQAIQIVQRR